MYRNPTAKVPALATEHFSTGESCTIVRYLAEKNEIWGLYPKDLLQRTRVNALIDEYHSTLKIGVSRTFWFEYMYPALGKTVDGALKKDANFTLRTALKALETRLSSTKSFLDGKLLSFADMLYYSELKQLDLVAFDFSSYASITRWMSDMTKLPNHDDMLVIISKLSASASKNGTSSPEEAKL